ncbi:hypothetical protein BR93DRAFT_976653 [Coniochaeta sp. PMI_546]|nr:hypothetical protein BR93DRAFT_976653 [Coniochaeta sp. PMI_546]
MVPMRRPDLQVFMSRKPTNGALPDPSAEDPPSAEEPSSAEKIPTVEGLSPEPEAEKESSSDNLSPRQKREAILWPCINLKSLVSKWWYMLQMLHSRGRHSIPYFALQDMPPARPDFLELFIRFHWVQNHFMALEENRDADADVKQSSYGRLVFISDAETSYKAVADKLAMRSEYGLILLEIQARLYKFLLDLVRSILHDIPEDLLESSIEVKPDPGLLSGAAAGLQQVWVADEREEAPYTGSNAQYHNADNRQVQLRFNQSVVKAKWNEALEHWQLLRYDPGYLAESVSQWKDHRVDLLRDTKGRASPLANSEIWTRAVRDCVMTAFQKMLYWDEAWRRMEFLQWLVLPVRSIEGRLASAHDMTERRDSARCFLYSYLSCWEESLIRLLRKIWTFSPRLRPYSRRIAREGSLSRKSATSSRASPPGGSVEEKNEDEAGKSKTTDDEEWRYDQDHEYEQSHTDGEQPKKRRSWQYFEWLFNCLYDRNVRYVLGVQTILDEIDYLVNSSAEAMRLPPQEHWMLSDLVNCQISDLATQSEIFEGEFKSPIDSNYHTMRALKRDRNWLIQQETLFEYRWKGGSGAGMRIRGPFTFEGSQKMWSLANPSDGRFDSPIDKGAKTEADVQQLARAKRALKHFWTTFDSEVKAQNVYYYINNTDILDFPKSPEELMGTSLEAQAEKQDAGSGVVKVEPEPEPEPEPVSDDESETLSDYGSNPALSYRHNRLHIRLDVDKKALRVFRTMFVPASKDWQPQPLPWKDFEHALLQADYKMSCRYGRAWFVVPPNGPPGCYHIFRQPNHGEKLTVATLRRYGLRLNWSAGGSLNFSQFTLRDTEETKEQTQSYSCFRKMTAYACLEEAKPKVKG